MIRSVNINWIDLSAKKKRFSSLRVVLFALCYFVVSRASHSQIILPLNQITSLGHHEPFSLLQNNLQSFTFIVRIVGSVRAIYSTTSYGVIAQNFRLTNYGKITGKSIE